VQHHPTERNTRVSSQTPVARHPSRVPPKANWSDHIGLTDIPFSPPGKERSSDPQSNSPHTSRRASQNPINPVGRVPIAFTNAAHARRAGVMRRDHSRKHRRSRLHSSKRVVPHWAWQFDGSRGAEQPLGSSSVPMLQWELCLCQQRRRIPRACCCYRLRPFRAAV
jgi:hypothetical protein